MASRKSKISWEYLAGFFDGEGWITSDFQQGKYHYINAGMCQHERQRGVLDEIMKFLAKHKIECQEYRRSTTDVIQLRIKGNENVLRFLEDVSPYLIVKATRAKEAVDYMKRVEAARREHGNAWRRRVVIPFAGLSEVGV